MEIEKSLLESLSSDDVTDLSAQLGDIALDHAIESGAFDGVPIFGTIRGLWKAGIATRDALYFRKVCLFLKKLQEAPREQRQAFLAELDQRGERDRFASSLLMMLDRLFDLEAPDILARIMSAHIRGDIPDYSTAVRLMSIVTRSHVPDLGYLLTFKSGLQDAEAIADSLFALGLLASRGLDGGTWEGAHGGTLYELSEYGRLLVRYGLKG